MDAIAALRIFVIEDNHTLRDLIVRALSGHGHLVTGLECGEDLGEVYLALQADIFIIDIQLPGEDGFGIAKRLRQTYPEAGIIIATARTMSGDRIRGYQAGADNYLCKPFEVAELVSVVDAVSRRCRRIIPHHDDLAANELRLNRHSFKLVGGNDEPVMLSEDEVAILDSLVRAPACEVETWQLLETLRLAFDEKAKRNLEVRMVRLRKKMCRAGDANGGIKSVRGKGYRLLSKLLID